jgi:glutamine synthetase
MKYKLEYVWLDGYKPEPNLRSKVRITGKEINGLQDIPEWGFDGSSTKQAEGYSSDCYLKPVRIYRKDGKQNSDTIYVLCEVMDSEGNPHNTNDRAKLDEDFNFWVGFEQEYFIRHGHNKPILGFQNGGVIDPQGVYYCGVGGQMYGRNLSEEHLDMCLNYNIGIEGTNAEVAIGQWEYQVFAKGKLKSADDLWMSRYFLYKIAEKYGYEIELHPKPLTSGDWNGSGLHTNFSNERMREQGGEEYFKSIFQVFESRADIHIQNYGSDNHLRLTGKHETQSINKFSWGVSDRGASIRAPKVVGEIWKGYLEDRRPASNGNPYSILRVISDSLDLAEDLDETLHVMYDDIDTSKLSKKFGTLSNKELLNEYQNDEEFELESEMMESKANVPLEEIKFNLNEK